MQYVVHSSLNSDLLRRKEAEKSYSKNAYEHTYSSYIYPDP